MTPLRAALAGNPNAGKTTLFNALTGLRQKVANYPGVTVERKEGWFEIEGRPVHLIDLPGIYSLSARSPEEKIAAEVIAGEDPPDVIVAIVDATNLERHLFLATQLMERARPVVIALNMMDLARERMIAINVPALAGELGVPVIPMAASKGEGVEELRKAVLEAEGKAPAAPRFVPPAAASARVSIQARYAWLREACARCVDRRIQKPHGLTERLDAVLTHRVAGLAIFLGLMLLVFVAIFTWARVPMDWIGAGVTALQGLVGRTMGHGPLASLLADGAILGVGAVVTFLPQILLLFFFIGLLEDTGYMARAAFLMDRLMRGVGLHGKSFIPLMSSFACAIPGIMATRTIENRKDRLATVLVAPLMSCSARLPVYTLMIGAFLPNHGALTMLSMYLLGMIVAVAMAWLFKRSLLKGPPPPFIMELPSYRMPRLRDVCLSMWDRSRLFLRRAGTVILSISLVLWFLEHYPKASDGGLPPVQASYAGRMGHALEPVIRPLGFDWRLGVGLVTSFAAREVMVGTLATLYGLEKGADEALTTRLRADYTPLAAVSLMVFFVLACQCMSTVAVVHRETNSWRWPVFMVGYMTALAYVGSLVVYQVGLHLHWGMA